MSNIVNDRLVEEAGDMMPELAGTGLDKVMEANIKNGDYEALWHNIIEGRNLLTNDEDWQLGGDCA